MDAEFHRLLRLQIDKVEQKVAFLHKQRDELDQEIVRHEKDLASMRALTDGGSANQVADPEAIALSEYAVTTGARPPRQLVLPTGLVKPLRTWKDLLVEIARHLVTSGQITSENCPIAKPRARKEVLIAFGKPNPETDYSEAVEIGGGLWLETHGNASELWGKACFLVENSGDDPQLYQLQP